MQVTLTPHGELVAAAIARGLGNSPGEIVERALETVVRTGLRVGLPLIGALLIWWEFRRRARRTVLVPRKGLLGIYRNGQFVETITPAQMTRFVLNRGVSLMMWMMPLAVFGLIFGSFSGTDGPDPLMMLCGVALLVGNSSSIFTRARFAHWRVPTKGRGGDEQVLLKKAEVGRLFDARHAPSTAGREAL